MRISVKELELKPLREFRKKHNMTCFADDIDSFEELLKSTLNELDIINHIKIKNAKCELGGIYKPYNVYDAFNNTFISSGVFTENDISELTNVYSKLTFEGRCLIRDDF